MFDKFFELLSQYLKSPDGDFDKDFFKNSSTNPNYYYYRVTTTISDNGETSRKVDTNIPSLQSKDNNSFISEATNDLKKTIEAKRTEMKQLAESEKFEEAITLKSEIATLTVELEKAIAADQEHWEKNKSARERLSDLTKQLDKAVKEEDYETAAKLRDQIKSL